MLRATHCPSSLVVCSTCRISNDVGKDEAGRTGGTLFAQALAAALVNHRCRGLVILQAMPCLFACSSHCTVYLRGQGRVGYILGRFDPRPEDAVALLDYAAHYLDSPDGVVPYARWPDGVKGHFLVRIPPDGFVWDSSGDASVGGTNAAAG